MRIKHARNTTTTSAGSAHLWLLGRSMVRFEEERDTGGGTGGEGGGGTGTTDQKTADTGSKERTYTAAEVEGIVKDRLAREKRNRAPEPDKKPSGKADTSDPTWVFDLQDAIDAQTEARDVKIPQGLKKRMRSAFAAEKPQDPNAWVGTWLDDVGLVKKTADANNTTTDTKTADKSSNGETNTSNTKPISDKGTAAVPGRDIEEITNPNDLTQVDIERIHKKHGEDKGNQLITDMAMKWLEKVRVVPDYGGPKKR